MKQSHNNVFPKEEVRSAIQKGIFQAQQIQNENLTPKRKPLLRKVIYSLSSAVAAFGILVGSAYVSPVLASTFSQIPIIGSVFGDSNLIGLQQAQKHGLTNAIGETETVNDISITIDEILYDQTTITIGYIINSEKELDEFYFGAGFNFTIDGKLPKGSSGGNKIEAKSGTFLTGIQTITVTDAMPETFELGLILNGAKGETWYFVAPIEQITEVVTIPVNHSESVAGIDLIVKQVTVSPTGIGLTFTSSEQGTDFSMGRGSYIQFKIVDQDGNEVTSHFGGVEGNKLNDRLEFTSKKRFDPIGPDVSELTITPYLALPTNGGGVELTEEGVLSEVDFNGDAIQSVEFQSFKVKLK